MSSRVNTVHYDQALTDFAISLPADQGMIADLVCPSINVRKESDVYYLFNREELKLHNVERADGAEAEEMDYSYSTATYSCKEFALKGFVTDREVENADAQIEPEMRLTEKLVTAVRLAREKRVVTLLQTTGNWGGNTTPSTKWNNSGGDIESDVKAAKQAFYLQAGLTPNVAVINDLIRDAIVSWMRGKGTYMPTAVASLAEWRALDPSFAQPMSGEALELRGFMGIQRWLVGQAVYDSAALGATESLSRLWGNHCTFLYVNPTPSMKSFSACYTFQKRGYAIKKWREESRDVTFIQNSHILTEKVTSSKAGYVLTTVLE